MLTNMGYYMAVRLNKDDGREWFDLSSYAGTANDAIDKARLNAITIPMWEKCHPIVRAVQVTITEVDE